MASPDIPPMKDYKSAQYEFNDEQNRQFSGLADAMRVTGGLMQLLGLAFVVFFVLDLLRAIQMGGGYGSPIGLGAAALLSLCIGFWTGGAATSFRKIAETKNEDGWHLNNAVSTLYNMYSLLRTIIFGLLVLAVIGVAMVVVTLVAAK